MRATLFVSASIFAILNVGFLGETNATLLADSQYQQSTELAQINSQLTNLIESDLEKIDEKSQELIDTLTTGDYPVHKWLMEGKQTVSEHLPQQLASKLVWTVGQPKENL